MARSLVLGNGNSLACLDAYGQVRDFYFPYAGQPVYAFLSFTTQLIE